MSKPVIVTTEHRGVFYGNAPEDTSISQETITLTGARMAIYWGTTKGLFELAHIGPNSSSRISAPADVQLNKVTAILDVTPEAVKAWSQV